MRRLWLGPSLAAAAALAAGSGLVGAESPHPAAIPGGLPGGEGRRRRGGDGEGSGALARAAALRPEPGEAQYLLGAVEKAMGRPDAARAAWLAVPPGSPFALHAALMLARGALVRDRHADAEPYLKAALGAAWPTGNERTRFC